MQNFFKDRSVYYSTFPIRDQAKRADWNYELKAVYTIGILDFIFDADKDEPNKFRYDVKLIDKDTQKVFYDKLTFIYLEMPKFNKSEDELETRFDKWLFVLRNLNKLEQIPEKLRELIFEKLFETAEIAKFSIDQVHSYEDSLKYYRDLNNSIDTARDEGKIEGKIEGRIEGKIEGRIEGEINGLMKVAKSALSKGIPIKEISDLTGLSEAEIGKLL